MAQGPARDSLLAEGIRLAELSPGAARTRFEALLALDSTDVTAHWRLATALSDLAEPLNRKAMRRRRDSLLALAQTHARRAVGLAPENARARFALGLVLGNTALTRGMKERVRLGLELRESALSALALDSTLDGAHHLLGRWHHEVMRLSGFERFIARTLLGGGAFSQASWSGAQHHLERAVVLDSSRVYHRLALAQVLLDRRDTAAARLQLGAISRLPDRVAADSLYRRAASALLARLGSRAGSPRLP